MKIVLSFLLFAFIGCSTSPNLPSAEEAEKEFQTSMAVDKEVIRKVIVSHLKEIKACYNFALKKDSDLGGKGGKVIMEWNIEQDGRATKARVKKSYIKNDELEKCMAFKINKWEFPSAPNQGNFVVSFPFLFVPKE